MLRLSCLGGILVVCIRHCMIGKLQYVTSPVSWTAFLHLRGIENLWMSKKPSVSWNKREPFLVNIAITIILVFSTYGNFVWNVGACCRKMLWIQAIVHVWNTFKDKEPAYDILETIFRLTTVTLSLALESKHDTSKVNTYIKIPLHRTYFGVKTVPSGKRSVSNLRCGLGNCFAAHSNAGMGLFIQLYYSNITNICIFLCVFK